MTTTTDDDTTIEEETTEEVREEAPFLRITSTTARNGGYDTISVEVNPGSEGRGEAGDTEFGSTVEWLIDLVTATVRELRGAGQVVVTGAALHTCGLPLADPPGEALGRPGSGQKGES